MKRLALLTPLAALAFAAACSDDTPLPVTPDSGLPPSPPSLAAAGGVSGANFTTTNPAWDRKGNNSNQKLCLHGQDPDSGANNCNHYGAKEYVWLNGGPLTAGLESGTYFWAVLAPGGQPDPNDGNPVAGGKNLSDDTDPVGDRTFKWNKTTGLIEYGGSHDFDKATMKLRVGVKPSPYKPKGPDWYADTPNKGGVYILAICRISSPSSYPVNPRDCKYDAFKVKDQSGPPEVMVNIWPDGVNEVGDDHTFTIRVKAVGGKPPYTFQITPSVDPSTALKSQTCTDASKHTATDDFTRECRVTVNSTEVGIVKVGATAKVTDANGYSTTSSTGPNTLPNSDDGYKYYVDAQIAITPQTATNGIGEEHKFTVTFTAYPGAATPTTFGAITTKLTPPSGFTAGTDYTQSSTCATPTGTGNVRSCTITINSSKTGVFKAEATGTVTMGANQDPNGLGATLTRTTDGSTTPGRLQNSGPATKEYVAGEISWRKVDQDGEPLRGAEFKAVRIKDRFGTDVADPQITGITDCVAAQASACTGLDKDHRAGYFKLTGLVFGTWRITETKAPTNYTADLTFRQDILIDLERRTGQAAQAFVNNGKFAGCTPGFWKQTQHFGYWHDSPYSPVAPQTLLSAAFEKFTGQGGYSSTMTMLQALDLDNSTGIGQVLRHGVAALLNAYSEGVFYGFQDDPDQVRALVNAALVEFGKGNQAFVDAAHAKLAKYNELGCTLSGQKYW